MVRLVFKNIRSFNRNAWPNNALQPTFGTAAPHQTRLSLIRYMATMKSLRLTNFSAALVFLALCAVEMPVYAKCFSSDVSYALSGSNLHRGKVVAVKTNGPDECEISFKIREVAVNGMSQAPEICRAKNGESMVVIAESYCCDNPPCPNGRLNGITFLKPTEDQIESYVDKGPSPEAAYQKGLIEYSRGNREEAIRIWKDVLRQHPGNVQCRKAIEKATSVK